MFITTCISCLHVDKLQSKGCQKSFPLLDSPVPNQDPSKPQSIVGLMLVNA
jgi:hypothetical protein